MVYFFSILLLFGLVKVPAPNFLGLEIGMNASEALLVVQKPLSALTGAKARTGETVISDTVPIGVCSLPMRRSLGFDSSETLTAVGLTYKSSPDNISHDRQCALDWLTSTYGKPTGSTIRDSVPQSIWKFPGAILTFESRNYNPNDYFVLIYYYKDEEARK